MQFKLLSADENIHEKFLDKFHGKENFGLLTLENTFKIQVICEFFLFTIPQLTVINLNANNVSPLTKWTTLTYITVYLMTAMLIKNLGLITCYFLSKFVDNK